jgi:uncharacterized protein YggE
MSQSSRFGYVALTLLAIAVIASQAVLAFVVLSKTAQPDRENTFTVTGSASTDAKPDKLIVSLGVETRSLEADKAVTSNAEVMSRVTQSIRAIGIGEDELKTEQYSLHPEFNFKDGQREFVGYVATNAVTVTTSKLELAGRIIDEASRSGANQIRHITFALAPQTEKELSKQLLQKAVADAKERAESTLSALGLRIIGVKSLHIADGIIFPRIAIAESAVREAGTPTFPGQISVTATVNVTFLIG